MLQSLFPGERPVFQDDNAPVPTVPCVQTWSDEHDDEMEHSIWCPQSPDFNIIELLCVFLEYKVYVPFPLPRTLLELETTLYLGWMQIPSKFVYDIYLSIPRQMYIVLKTKGAPIPY